jgi:regulatory subunit for Cdc7p protein kinase
MASTSRQPFTSRSSQSLHPAHSPARVLKPAQAHKRARSPDSSAHNLGSFIKKHKPTASNANSAVQTFKKDRTSEYVKRKEQQRNDREQQRLEFKEKYRRAFPGWTFYLDSESIDAPQLESFRSRILQLEGVSGQFNLTRN